ncbi:MAG: iron transporter [Candidatus Melainabacteria bacterium]|nr:MAG: iron transporter [Candidatus Melainabacteria bacterium]
MRTRHVERHFTAGALVKDVVIGMSDGLTVPFALAAGLSGATTSSSLVVTGGLAEVAAGAIAMGLGGYLAAKSDSDHYFNERKREAQEIIERPDEERLEVEEVFRSYGLDAEQIAPILKAFQEKPQQWVNFMMRFELGIDEPDPGRAMSSAVTIASAYAIGGLIPLAPYMILGNVRSGLIVSIIITLIALAIFGYIKGRFTGNTPMTSAVQTLLIGSLAGAAAFFIARLVS